MKAVVLPVPDGWRQLEPPRSRYEVAPGLVLDVSAVQGLPEDPPAWLAAELVRLGATRAAATAAPPRPVTTRTRWNALIADAPAGDEHVQLVLWQFLELAAVATLRGPAAAYAAHVDAVTRVLLDATVHWGDPPVTIAALYDAIVATKPR